MKKTAQGTADFPKGNPLPDRLSLLFCLEQTREDGCRNCQPQIREQNQQSQNCNRGQEIRKCSLKCVLNLNSTDRRSNQQTQAIRRCYQTKSQSNYNNQAQDNRLMPRAVEAGRIIGTNRIIAGTASMKVPTNMKNATTTIRNTSFPPGMLANRF